MSDAVYKIRRRVDGLFSTGGSAPRFTKNGKMWSTIANLKRHLSGMRTGSFEDYYSDCEIVEYVECRPISLETVIEEIRVRHAALERQRVERRGRWRQEALELEIERKKAELEALLRS